MHIRTVLPSTPSLGVVSCSAGLSLRDAADIGGVSRKGIRARPRSSSRCSRDHPPNPVESIFGEAESAPRPSRLASTVLQSSSRPSTREARRVGVIAVVFDRIPIEVLVVVIAVAVIVDAVVPGLEASGRTSRLASSQSSPP